MNILTPFINALWKSGLVLAAFLTLSSSANPLYAQCEVTFHVNLKPQLEDSIFVPGRDLLQVKGNRFPLGPGKKVPLRDTEPIDSVYSVTIRFSTSSMNERLEYNYVINRPEDTLEESMPRQLDLRMQEIVLDPLYFDAFAW